jgi:hypothetical protein
MAWYDVFTGGAFKTIEGIANEWIDTDIEKAQAGKLDAESRSLLVKVLDPNGKMRRDLSRFACKAYAFYLGSAVFLIFMQMLMAMFEVGNIEAAKEAVTSITGLFLPITASWSAIVAASFGVNATNSIKGK